MTGCQRIPIILLRCLWLLAVLAASLRGEERHSAAEIIARTLRAAGTTETIEKTKVLQFATRISTYTVWRDGSMKMESALAKPYVYQSLVVTAAAVTQNQLGIESFLTGAEAERMRCLGLLYGGLFTLEKVAEGLQMEGEKRYGPERFYVLSRNLGVLKATFFVDAADYSVRRLVFSREGIDEWCYEFSRFESISGVRIPRSIFTSQVGVQGTGSPGAQPILAVEVNPEVPATPLLRATVAIGDRRVVPGILEGRILCGFFDEESLFTALFTNWGTEEIEEAGLRSGDRVTVTCGEVEFETTFFVTEDEVNDPRVYEPGNSLFIRNQVRYPMFYMQFNTLSPREKFDRFRAVCKEGAEIRARRKTKEEK